MIGILVTGPNASGKTTATMSALAPWVRDPRLATVYADNSDRAAFKGTMNDMVDRMETIWRSSAELVVVEGTNRIATVLGYLFRRLPDNPRVTSCHVTLMAPEFMEASIRARCLEKGKRFRDDYWTHRVLEYESQRRYKSVIRDYFGGCVTQYWPIAAGYDGAAEMSAWIRDQATAVLGKPQPRPEYTREEFERDLKGQTGDDLAEQARVREGRLF